MKIYLDNALGLGIIVLIILNAIFHVIGYGELIHPFGTQAVMTFFTSVSVGCLAGNFLTEDKGQREAFSLAAIGMQILSTTLHFTEYDPSLKYFLPSSISTSLFVITASTILFIENKDLFKDSVTSYFGPFLFLLCIFMVYVFIADNLVPRSIVHKRLGIGLNLYTLITFFHIAGAITFRYTKVISLYELKIGYRPTLAFFMIIAYGTTNYLLVFCKSPQVHLVSLFVQIFFLAASYWFICRPFHAIKDKFITICSWTRQIRTQNSEWHATEELFSKIGLTVTHGISEEQYKKIRNRVRD